MATRSKRRDRRRPSPNRPGGPYGTPAAWFAAFRASQTSFLVTPVGVKPPSAPGATDVYVLFPTTSTAAINAGAFLAFDGAASYPVTAAVLDGLGNVTLTCPTAPAGAVTIAVSPYDSSVAAVYGVPVAPAMINFEAFP